MTSTPRFKWPIPRKDSDNWYEPFVALQNSVDTSTFANTEDRNAICMGGGTFEFTQLSGLLTWDGTIEILSANTGFVRSVEADEIVLDEGELFLVELQRFPTENSIALPQKASNLSSLANINDTFVLAIRRNNLIYFRNGKNMQDGDSFKVFETAGNGGGSVFTSSPVSGNGTVGSPITISANAITNAKLATMAANTLKGNDTGVLATPGDLTATQVKALLAITAGDVSGLAAIATTGSASNLSTGTIPATRMPAFFGDVKTTIGTLQTVIEPNSVANTKLATMPTLTLKGNNTGSTINALDLTVSQVRTMLGIFTPTPFYFGTGSDGSVVMDGIATVNGMVPSGNVYTAARSYHWIDLTIDGGITFKPDGNPQFVSGNLGGSGTSDSSGFPGVSNISGNGVQGSPAWLTNRNLPGGAAGGLAGLLGSGPSQTAIRPAISGSAAGGATGANVGSTGGVLQGGGGGGGAGSSGGDGGTVTNVSAIFGDWEVFTNATTGTYPGTAQNARAYFSTGSGGGGGGRGSSTGPGGGGSAGWQVWFVRAFTGTVLLRSNGGDGANGTPSGGFASGGAGGGAGGVVVLVCGPSTTPPTPQVNGGAGGLASAGTGSAASGGAGGIGKVLIIQ